MKLNHSKPLIDDCTSGITVSVYATPEILLKIAKIDDISHVNNDIEEKLLSAVKTIKDNTITKIT